MSNEQDESGHGHGHAKHHRHGHDDEAVGSSGPLEARATVKFLTKHLPAQATVLDVGCGDGTISSRLARSGFSVVALDANQAAVTKARENGVDARQASWPQFDGDLVDALLFVRSLHHIEPLDGAIERAAALVKPGGHLLVDEFDWQAVDAATLAWFQAEVRALVHRGLLESDTPLLLDDTSPDRLLDAWNAEYEGIHTGAQMDRAIQAHFRIEGTETSAYLYAYIEEALSEHPEEVQPVRDREIRLAQQGKLVLLGRRWRARRV